MSNRGEESSCRSESSQGLASEDLQSDCKDPENCSSKSDDENSSVIDSDGGSAEEASEDSEHSFDSSSQASKDGEGEDSGKNQVRANDGLKPNTAPPIPVHVLKYEL